jgi:carboxylate-amine ligase
VHTSFGQSTPYSVGIEEEYQLLDETDLGLISCIEPILASFAGDPVRPRIKPELLQSAVEVSTRISSNVADAVEDLADLRSRLRHAAAEHGVTIAAAGTHPFSGPDQQLVTARPRYVRIADELGWLTERHLVFGLHVHIGVSSNEKAIACANGLRAFIPELLALAANSPYWRGRSTGFCSTRAIVATDFPRSGPPPFFADFDDFEQLVERSQRAGLFPEYTHIWWDLRPHPLHGTVELRVYDAQTRIENVAALAALVQSLVATLGSAYECGEPPPHVPDFLLEENRWRAARDGLDAILIDVEHDSERAARVALISLLDRCRPAADALGCTEELELVQHILERGNGAEEQRRVYGEMESVNAVAQFLVDHTTAELLASN